MKPRVMLGFSLKLTYILKDNGSKKKKKNDNGSMTFTNEANNDHGNG